jgi:ankyrin repeat protein
MVRALIELGADINKASDKGVTPLHIAAQKGH